MDTTPFPDFIWAPVIENMNCIQARTVDAELWLHMNTERVSAPVDSDDVVVDDGTLELAERAGFNLRRVRLHRVMRGSY